MCWETLQYQANSWGWTGTAGHPGLPQNYYRDLCINIGTGEGEVRHFLSCLCCASLYLFLNAKGSPQFSLAVSFITVLWCKDFDTCFGDVTFWIRISKTGVFWRLYRVYRRKEATVKAVGGKEFGYEGKKVICGARNNTSKEVFKARKILMVLLGRGKAIFIRKIEMVSIKLS